MATYSQLIKQAAEHVTISFPWQISSTGKVTGYGQTPTITRTPIPSASPATPTKPAPSSVAQSGDSLAAMSHRADLDINEATARTQKQREIYGQAYDYPRDAYGRPIGNWYGQGDASKLPVGAFGTGPRFPKSDVFNAIWQSQPHN